MENIVFSIPVAEMPEMIPWPSPHSSVIRALTGGRHDFPVTGRCLHGEATYTKAQVPFLTPLGVGGEILGAARQWI